eukprot:5377845-Alexandrium_andersonii.AAC.1
MSASLVGSEMCIRDRGLRGSSSGRCRRARSPTSSGSRIRAGRVFERKTCLLYTSDAADDM